MAFDCPQQGQADAGWPATSCLIDAFCGTMGNSLVFGDGTGPDDIDIFFARHCFLGFSELALILPVASAIPAKQA